MRSPKRTYAMTSLGRNTSLGMNGWRICMITPNVNARTMAENVRHQTVTPAYAKMMRDLRREAEAAGADLVYQPPPLEVESMKHVSAKLA